MQEDFLNPIGHNFIATGFMIITQVRIHISFAIEDIQDDIAAYIKARIAY